MCIRNFKKTYVTVKLNLYNDIELQHLGHANIEVECVGESVIVLEYWSRRSSVIHVPLL